MTFSQRVIALLAEHGPMHAREIAEELGLAPNVVRAKLGQHRARWPGQIRIAEYRREVVDGRFYPRACYAVGAGPDAPRLGPLSKTEYNRRYRRAATGQANSVWALATKLADRRKVA